VYTTSNFQTGHKAATCNLMTHTLYQGSQIRDLRAACGPRRRHLRPATHYLKFYKFSIKISSFILFTAFFK